MNGGKTSPPSVAIILCAGRGVRFGGKKQFFKLAGKPVCIHTLNKFLSSGLFDKIYLVIPPEDKEYVEQLLEKHIAREHRGKIRLCSGGESRQESSMKGVECAAQDRLPDDTRVLVHDAVRPFVDREILERNLETIGENQATDTVVDAIDTIVRVDDEGFIVEIPERRYLKYGQTPQGFLLKHLKEMYRATPREMLPRFTDDCGIFLRVFPEKKIKTVPGSYFNIKITTPLDLYIADKIFLLRSSGLDVKLSRLQEKSSEIKNMLKDRVIVVFGGTSGIGEAVYNLAREMGLTVYRASRRLGVDIRSPHQVRDFLEKVYSEEGRLDHVVVTSGILVRKPLEEMSYREIMDQITTNYWGSIVAVKEALPYLHRTKSRPKHIVLFSSSSYTRGRGSYSIYSSSKAAIVNLVQALCEETEDVNFNAIVPERTMTPMRRQWFGKEDPSTLLKPETVAWYTLYLLTQDICGMAVEVRKNLEDT